MASSQDLHLSPSKAKRNVDEDISSQSTPKKFKFDFWGKKPDEELATVATKPTLVIAELKEHQWNAGIIRGRCVQDGEINKSSKLPVMTYKLLDSSGEILVKAFGLSAVRMDEEKLFQFNKGYAIQNFMVKVEKPSSYNDYASCRFIDVTPKTLVEEIEAGDFPTISWNFITLEKINALEDRRRADIIGIITEDHGVETTSKGQFKRDLEITDSSKTIVPLVLWGKKAEINVVKLSPIVVHQGLIGTYERTKYIGVGYSSSVLESHDIPEVEELMSWFQTACTTQQQNQLCESDEKI